MKIFYKPSYFYLIIDLVILILSLYVVLDWFPLTTNSPFTKYSGASLCFIFSWFIFSYLLKRYRPLKKQQYFATSLRLFYVSSVNFIVFAILIHYFFKPYSGYVLLAITVGTFLVNYIVLSCYFAYKFAVDYNEISLKPRKKRINAKVKLADKLAPEAYAQLEAMIFKQSTAVGLRFLKKQIDLTSGNTLVFTSNSAADLKNSPVYQYDTIVQLERLNNMREINKKLAIINEKLPDNGIFVCCFESKSTRKKRILKNNPKVINYILYVFDFLFKRVMPKFILTKWLYYYITRGNNRIFSKAEVLGRLYCSGFKVILEKKIGQLTYVIAQREKEPETTQKRIYGPLIRLTRYGKDGEMIKVYKMRTMHPFSEYLQGYIYKRNSLNVDGKFNRDIRITTIGSFMRKYWIDELPMFINLFNGEMKLVGVRPLSKQYYSLYNSDLQKKRLKFKPGLLPPFYADLPHSLDEIQDSEMRYLVSCESKGAFKTDLIYFFQILKNILINNARSG
jgi:lipopolysaccharide/colanic/teichoic acid biosynthesis glycosyltransferase